MLSFLRKQKQRPKGLVSIQFTDDGIALTHATQLIEPRQLEMPLCTFLPCSDPKQRSAVLKSYIFNNKLSLAHCSCILTPSDYRLFLLDPPNVPVNEMKSAARFLVRDFIDFPLNLAAVDYFDVPLQDYPPKIYVVVTKQKLLETLTLEISRAGLNLGYIDISELALRNLLSLSHPSASTLAFIFSHRNELYVMITQRDQMLLIRKIGPLDSIDHHPDSVLSELQQSLGYFQNQISHTSPDCLLISPSLKEDSRFRGNDSRSGNDREKAPPASFGGSPPREGNKKRLDENDSESRLAVFSNFSKQLNLPLEWLDLNSKFTLPVPLSENLQSRCLMTLGESLFMPEILKSFEGLA